MRTRREPVRKCEPVNGRIGVRRPLAGVPVQEIQIEFAIVIAVGDLLAVVSALGDVMGKPVSAP